MRNLDFQFCIAVYVRSEYENKQDASTNLYSEWGGLEAPNSWKGCLKRAEEIVSKNPEYLCVVIDMMNRKPIEIITHRETVNAN